ncbi:hypothetical protein LT493_16790 [Streptomyces tricolor]|nr:hypothetical protein [Streptomyces tricolor]
MDPERAKEGPFGAPVAHGYLTLSLFIRCSPSCWTSAASPRRSTTGPNKVRFTHR